MSFVIHIFLHVKCTLQTTSNVPCICTVQSTSHTCIRMYIWCTFVRSFNAHWLCDSKCTLQCVCNVHYTGTSKCAFKCTFFTMHIGGTSYALYTMYIQCTLEVVRNAQNSFQIEKDESGVWRTKRGLRGSGEIHFEGRELTDRVVRHRVIGEADSLGVLGPLLVLGLRQISHGAIPESPPWLDFPVGLWVVSAGGSALCAGDGRDEGHQIAQELRSIVRMDDVGGAAAKI